MKIGRAWGMVGLIAIVSAGLLVACGGGDEGGVSEFRRGGKEVEESVDGFIRGWMRGSGPARDTIAASQTRRYLGGELGTRVASAKVGGSQTEEPLERVFNEIVGVPFPPDGDPPYEIVENVQDSDTEATITVKLNYTAGAASSLAALGIISFDNVATFQEQVNGETIRVLRLVEDETLGWQIHEITDPNAG